MKVIIAGSRTIDEYRELEKAIDASGIAGRITEVVSGHARGVDTMGEWWAFLQAIPTKLFIAQWNTYGQAAGPIRNGQMGRYADAAIIVWDGFSRGTANMIEIMDAHKKPAFVWTVSLGRGEWNEHASKL